MRNNLRMKVRAMNMALAVCAMSTGGAAQAAVGATAAATSAMVSLHPAARLHTGDKVLGPLAFLQPMHVVVALKLRNEQQLDDYIAEPRFRPLTSGQFQLMYSPTKEQAQAVADYLTKVGFSNVKIAPDHALVEADGHADTAQAAFNTSFVHVQTHDGRDAFANSSEVRIPANLQGTVRAVLGLQNVHIAHGYVRAPNPLAAHAMAPQGVAGLATGHQPSDFPVIYGASGMANVTSIPVGSISVGPMGNVLSDLKSAYPNVTITLLGDTSVGNGSGTNGGDVEWDLDSQDIIAFTGAKQYYFYVAAAEDDANLETAIAQVVSDNLLKAIDFSIGECETDAQSDGAASAMDMSFKQAVAQGQTFFVSAGDKGADECGGNNGTKPSWPASSQYVTAVGGTELYTGPNTTWQNEVVYNNLGENEGATGGSESGFEPLPGWQDSLSAYIGVYYEGLDYRAISDIAFDGSPDSGALITVDGKANQQYGGTSLSAPLATGMWARVLQADGPNLGFAAPVVYQVAQSSQINYSNAFHDVTSGGNPSLAASPGWDFPTGWGSIVVNQFAGMAVGSPSTPVVSFGTLPALQVTTPIPNSTHTPGDFNGDGFSDILWFNPTSSQVGYWTMSATANTDLSYGNVTRTGLSSYNVTPNYFVGAVGDFNNDGYADLVFTSANRDLWLWTNNQHGGWTSTQINNASYPSQWQLIGAGDIDGDGYDDLLWLDPSDCKFGYWTMKGNTVTGYHTINIACGYYPVSIGYYTPSNRLSIIWTSPADDLYIWDSNGDGTFKPYDLTSGLSNLPPGSHIISLGGGYKGQDIGVQSYTQQGTEGGLALSTGWLFSRSFDVNGNQTNVQWTMSYGGSNTSSRIASAGYVIAGSTLSNTGVYDIDPVNLVIQTGGLFNSNLPEQTGNAPGIPVPEYPSGYNKWTYPSGWWVVGAFFNNTSAPPWR